MPRLIDESLRWLIANGKIEEARRVLEKAARINKVDSTEVMGILDKYDTTKYPDAMESRAFEGLIQKGNTEFDLDMRSPVYTKIEKSSEMLEEKSNMIDAKANTKVKRYTPLDILRHKHVLFTSLICWYTWLVNSLTYYGLYMISSELAGNRFLNYFLGAIVEYPACMLEFILINRIGRKKTCILFHATAAISLILASILMTLSGSNYSIEVLTTVFILMGKMAITGSFSSIFLYTPELYPTNLRNAGLGMSSTVSRIGGMLAPYSTTLARYAVWAPGAIFGGLCLLVTFLLTFLPETMNVELPQTIEELNDWYENRSKNKKAKQDREKNGYILAKSNRLVPADIIRTDP
ncbi:hypothetical protein ScPMuIL_018096 [Solemya velum]